MSQYYFQKRNNDEDTVILGYRANDGSLQEARISLRYGANLCRYTYKGWNIIDYEPSLMKASDFTGTPVLYPTPNRVENGAFAFEGKMYQQIKRGKRIFEHGLVYDEPWELLDVVATDKNAMLSARILWDVDSPLFEAFPFKHSLTLTFCLLDGSIEISFHIENNGSEPLPFGFGLHPYFQKLSGEDGTLIMLPVSRVMEAGETLLPTGKTMSVIGTKLDLNQVIAIGALDLDHVFMREVNETPAFIFYKEQNIEVSIHATDAFSYYVVYSPPGMPYFCIENQTCSTNAHNLFDAGLRDISGLKVIAPGEYAAGSVQYKIHQG